LGKYKLTAVHSNLNDDWAFDSFVFYSLNSLGKEKEVHSAYFKARQDGTIGSDESVAAFFKSYGVTIEQMQKEMEKPELIGVINEMLAREIQVKSKGTPSFIVGGKYMVKLEGLGDFGGWSGLGEILNQLAEKSINESQKK
jgi:thiol:disulfide interchange protein DsbA